MGLSTTAPTQREVVTQKDTYRLVVFNQPGTAVLLDTRAGQYQLPLVTIPRFTRPAEEITVHIANQWHVTSVLLYVGVLELGPDTVYSAILEAQVRVCSLPVGMDWFPVHHAIGHLLKNQDQKLLDSSYLKVTSRTQGEDSEPFTRLGWLRELQNWVRGVLRPLGMELRGFHQLNGCETFSLIRLDTNRYPVWFKAVGKPNLHEYGISQALARLLPDYVPTIIAARPDWHGWLMADAGGKPLRGIGSPARWKSTAETLGRLQMESVGMVEDFADAGCRDLGMDTLIELVDPFVEAMGDLMRQQRKSPPNILTQDELSELGERTKDAIHSIVALRIPKALGHSDFNPGNIIVGPERCTFIDWAEAYVGNPLLTFEYLLAHLRKDYPELVPFESDFRACYSRAWSSIISHEQIAEACLYSPLIAVFAYAAGGHAWKDAERLKIPGFQGYMRSLARRMEQEADLLQRRRVECLN